MCGDENNDVLPGNAVAETTVHGADHSSMQQQRQCGSMHIPCGLGFARLASSQPGV